MNPIFSYRNEDPSTQAERYLLVLSHLITVLNPSGYVFSGLADTIRMTHLLSPSQMGPTAVFMVQRDGVTLRQLCVVFSPV